MGGCTFHSKLFLFRENLSLFNSPFTWDLLYHFENKFIFLSLYYLIITFEANISTILQNIPIASLLIHLYHSHRLTYSLRSTPLLTNPPPYILNKISPPVIVRPVNVAFTIPAACRSCTRLNIRPSQPLAAVIILCVSFISKRQEWEAGG